MWICRKCNSRVADGGKICRACGSILEDVADEPGDCDYAREACEAETTTVTASADEVGWSAPDEEPSAADNDGETLAAATTDRKWKCPDCGEVVPGNFDVCWNCMKTRQNDECLDDGNSPAGSDEDDWDAEPRAQQAPVVQSDERTALRRCDSCGSTDMIVNATVMNGGDAFPGQLRAVVGGNPQAVIFREAQYRAIKADICGECGRVELRISDPQAFYEHFLRSTQPKGQASDKHKAFTSTPCAQCGMLVVEGSSHCPHCGSASPSSTW